MARIETLHKALKAKNNEFYTRYEDVEFFVLNSLIKDYLKDKVVYLPCDTEESNIYKYLVDNKENLCIKEILRTNDDYYSHQDLYDKCDVVFTNPPFTKIGKWLNWLNGQSIKYISWFQLMGLYGWLPGRASKDTMEAAKAIGAGIASTMYGDIYNGHYTFDTPDGSSKDIAILIISNDDYFDNFEHIGRSFSKSFEEAKDKLFKLEDGYEVSKSPDIPYDYFEGYLYIPGTAYIGRQKYYEYYGCADIVCKDGKIRPRIKVKLKKEEINKIKQE